jgi:hypothetical protein
MYRSASVVALDSEQIRALCGRYPSSTIHGATTPTLYNDGRTASVRDYYELWGDISDEARCSVRGYRRFVRWELG